MECQGAIRVLRIRGRAARGRGNRRYELKFRLMAYGCIPLQAGDNGSNSGIAHRRTLHAVGIHHG